MINQLVKEAHQHAKDNGFYENPLHVITALSLIHGEVTEAVEAEMLGNRCGVTIKVLNITKDEVFNIIFKHKVKDTLEDELADIILRTMDLAGALDIDLHEHIKAKMRYNKTRGYKHGKNIK